MKIKPILIIAITLVIGFVLGMLTSAQIRHSRMKDVRRFVSGKDYAEMMMEAIQPDEVQKAKLEEVMSRFYETTKDMQTGFRNDFDSVTTSFKKEIDTLLTKEQLGRMHALEDRNNEMMQKMRKPPREFQRPRAYHHDSLPPGRGERHPNSSPQGRGGRHPDSLPQGRGGRHPD